MKPLFPILILLATPALAQDQDDAAHRADRLRTQELNSRSPNGYASPPPSGVTRSEYARAQAEYREKLDEWRQRVRACEAGYYEACQR